MILTICLQESKLTARRQVGGPARGYAQFEQGGGVTGVFNHPSTAGAVKIVCAALDVSPTIVGIYSALEQNDVLAAALARLLLWTLPNSIPPKENPEAGWLQYIAAWRPGAPHKDTWANNWSHAWAVVDAVTTAEKVSVDAMTVKKDAIDFISGFEKLRGDVAKLVLP